MNIESGDSIKFKAATRSGHHTVVRKVNGLYKDKWPTVRYLGWDKFVVHTREIIEVNEEPYDGLVR